MRRLCWFALPFCGAALCVCLGLPHPLVIGLAFAGLGVLAGVLARWGVPASGFLRRVPLWLACLGLALGLLWTAGYARVFRAPAEALAGRTAPFSASVTGWPRETSSGSFGVEVRLRLAGAPDARCLLYTGSSGEGLRPGDRISGSARFQLANVVRGEEVSTYEARGIFLRANAVGELDVSHPSRPGVTVWPAYISRALKESVAACFPGDVSGLMTALLTGDKAGLSDGDYAALRRAGVAHIAAVSGLHLSFFAGLAALFFRRRSRVGAGITILLCFLFAAVAGFTPSVLRAACMASMTLLAPLLGREEDRATTLSAALFLLLAVNPYAVLSVSLQLSFGSVAGISVFSGPLHRAMTRHVPAHPLFGRAIRFTAASLSVTLGALVFTTPLTAYYFGSVSLAAPLVNLLVLWAVSILFPAGLLLAFAGLALPGAAAALAALLAPLARYVLVVARAFGRLCFSAVSMDSGYLRAWLALVYVLLLLTLLFRRRRPIVPVCAGVLTLCAALVLHRASVLPGPLTATVLDVGQGQSIFLYSGGYTALIDCGGSGGNAGDVAADYLQALGISRLDLLVLTHCHDDHANGVPQLCQRLEVGELVLPELSRTDEGGGQEAVLALAEEQGVPVTLLDSNRGLAFGEAQLALYAPLGDGGANEEGLFVLASCGEFDLLVTGDANAFVESLLVKYDSPPDVEVLVAGHHGSKTSTSDTLLDAVTPEICLISVGYNTYGHPAPETLDRLEARDITVYRTDRMGNLTIRLKGETDYAP